MNLDYQKDYWLNFANTANINDLAKDLNGSWDAETQSYGNYSKIDDEALSFLRGEKMENVLDFGAEMLSTFLLCLRMCMGLTRRQ